MELKAAPNIIIICLSIPYHKPGDKPLTRKERLLIARLENQYEIETLKISLTLKAYYP
jgi:hypothetical protein